MEAIKWCNDHILVLDQRKLPQQSEWISIRTAGEMAQAIREMVLRGAPLIGIAAAYSLALESGRLPAGQSSKSNLSQLKEIATMLQATRPTAVNLSWALRRMLKQAEHSLAKNESLQEALEKEAAQIHREDQSSCEEIGKLGATLLPGGSVLTYCNTGALATGGAGTAYAILKEGWRQSKLSEALVCESRPYLQGARLTAYELQADGIPYTLITDSMAGHFMSKKKVAAVVVGADRIAANGDAANKIGTYTLAVLAKENGIPFFVAAPLSSFDFSLPTGQNIPIEERDPNEVTRIFGNSIVPEGARAAHPAFDMTPARYITAFVTDKGIAKPPYPESLARLREDDSMIITLPLTSSNQTDESATRRMKNLQRYRAIVEKLSGDEAHLVLEDGTRLIFPLSKLPSGVSEGTFLRLAVGVDRIAAFLHKPSKQELVLRGMKP